MKLTNMRIFLAVLLCGILALACVGCKDAPTSSVPPLSATEEVKYSKQQVRQLLEGIYPKLTEVKEIIYNTQGIIVYDTKQNLQGEESWFLVTDARFTSLEQISTYLKNTVKDMNVYTQEYINKQIVTKINSIYKEYGGQLYVAPATPAGDISERDFENMVFIKNTESLIQLECPLYIEGDDGVARQPSGKEIIVLKKENSVWKIDRMYWEDN